MIDCEGDRCDVAVFGLGQAWGAKWCRTGVGHAGWLTVSAAPGVRDGFFPLFVRSL